MAATLFSSPTPNSPKTLIPKIQPPFSSSLHLRSHRKTLAPIPPKPSLPLLRVSSSSCDAAPLTPTPRTLKSRLAAGETLYGLFLLSSSPTLAEIAGLAGYDYVVVDLEHGPGGLAVSYCRFPPRGVRGSAHTVVRASAYGLDDAYLARCEDELLIAVQVESAPAVAAIESIAAVDGVDVVQMGPLDLSASMGYLWDPGNRKVREAVKDAERRVFAVRNNNGDGGGGPYLGGFAMPHDGAEQLKLRGYHMVAGAVDVGMFRAAAVEDVRRFRSAVAEIGEEDDGDDKPKDEEYWSE
ncbi:2-keto-3-deoxy-L-rhamnonate aldolase [Ananas comosus]|uniref:2-keto-3-deoxy-L-rhamnonate aldolase n=1 Tax=Ananas comosus TaxID=4615 RepID=A0A199UTU2_ANACO|nr:2-keto-3-deoxy-L-rhamnonate aldolase [Ananas comosus]